MCLCCCYSCKILDLGMADIPCDVLCPVIPFFAGNNRAMTFLLPGLQLFRHLDRISNRNSAGVGSSCLLNKNRNESNTLSAANKCDLELDICKYATVTQNQFHIPVYILYITSFIKRRRCKAVPELILPAVEVYDGMKVYLHVLLNWV